MFRLVLLDCPNAVAFKQGQQLSMLECTVAYQKNTPDVALQIGLSGTAQTESYIANCIFTNGNQSPPGSAGIGLQILAAEHVRVVSSRIEGFQQGIIIEPGADSARKLFFDNVDVFTTSDSSTTGAALLIQPASTKEVTQVEFVGCQFGPDPVYGTTYELGGVYLNQAGGGGGPVDQVRFVSCYSCGWQGPGIQINGASNVEILGGSYSCNAVASASPPTASQAGIYIEGATAGVRIVGAACNNAIEGQLATQEYGISVQGSFSAVPANIFVRGCDLKGNLSSAIYGNDLNNLQVTNCAGYNDQALVLATVPPAAPGTTINNLLYHYYGPIAFYVSGGSAIQITIDSHLTGLTSGGFTLACGEKAVLSWTGIPVFLVVGK